MNLYSDSLKKDLLLVDDLISSVHDSESRLIREVGEYLELGRGKKLRPALAILAARACGKSEGDSDVVAVASCVELFHVATLLHDDVIDEARNRRGRPSVNAKWSNSVAILMADYLYASAFDLSLSSMQPEILRLLCQVSQRMCEGEMYQIEKEGQVLTREDYFKIIEHKTARLFSACAGVGAMVANGDGDAVARLSEFGFLFGVAFQITDDTLDYTAADRNWGKPVGGDIAGGKQTLPLIHTLEVASPDDRSALLGMMNNGRDFQGVLSHIEKYNGLDHAREVARDYASRATQSLDGWQGNGQLQPFRDLCDYVVSRGF